MLLRDFEPYWIFIVMHVHNFNEELHILNCSPNIIRQIKSRRMRWAGHVARMGEECVQGFDGRDRRKETI
jgi:hypothetical protein